MSLPVNIHTHRIVPGNVIQILSCDYQTLDRNAPFFDGETTFRSLAFHPLKWQPGNEIDQTATSMLLERKDVIAIGESGLDRHSAIPVERQVQLFHGQAELSERTDMPVVIHCVGRWNELELLFKAKKPGTPPWIIHGFRKTKLLQKFLDLGAYLSFGHALLYDALLQEAVKSMRFDRIFLETDEADVDILALYEKLAAVKSLSLPAVTDQLYLNFTTVFHHGRLA